VALVSRLPVRSWWVKRFPPAPFRLPLLLPGPGPKARFLLIPDEPRVALAAVVERPDGPPFTVVTTHLSFVPGYNVAQLRRLVAWAAAFPAPLFVLGDLNLPGGLPARVSRLKALVTGPTYPASRPRVQLDHVLARGVRPGQAQPGRVWSLPVSDHRAVSVDVEM
jgi:endonuclease/exonuclease/phosphatase family metal-dependent hydrolase